MAHGFSTHRIHVYIHLVDFDGKCRYARMMWGMHISTWTRKGAHRGRCTVRLCQSKTRQLEILISYKCCLYIPHSIHGTGIFTYISLMFMGNVGKCIIHGWYGYKNALTISIHVYICGDMFCKLSDVFWGKLQVDTWNSWKGLCGLSSVPWPKNQNHDVP